MYRIVFTFEDKSTNKYLLEKEYKGFDNCFKLFHDKNDTIKEILNSLAYITDDIYILIQEKFNGFSRTIYNAFLDNIDTSEKETIEIKAEDIKDVLTTILEDHKLSYLIIEDQKMEKENKTTSIVNLHADE